METIRKYRPLFKSKRVLKATQLEQLADQTFFLPNCLYYNFSNGIMSGFEITVEKNNLMISPGVFRFHNEMFVIDREVILTYEHNDKLMYLKLCFVGTKATGEEQENEFYITLDDTPTTKSDIELCRFRLQIGARLRTIYDDFDDMNTEFNTVNLIYTPYSNKDRGTLNPIILKRFATEMMKFKNDNMLDKQFCMQIICSSSIPLDGVLAYLKLRDEIELEQSTNIKVYKELQAIIGAMKNIERPIERKAFPKRKIIVD